MVVVCWCECLTPRCGAAAHVDASSLHELLHGCLHKTRLVVEVNAYSYAVGSEELQVNGKFVERDGVVGCWCSVSLGVWRAPGDLVKKPVVRIPPDGLELDGLFGVVGGGELDLGDAFS